MAKLFPGVLVAILAAVPGWSLGAPAASPKLLQRPLADNLAVFIRGTPLFLLLFGVITLTYGSLAWLVLRSVNALNLLSLIVAALTPVAAYVIFSLLVYGFDRGWQGPRWLSAFQRF